MPSSDTKGSFFVLVSYRTDTDGLVQPIEKKRNSIRAYALIKHDQDEAKIRMADLVEPKSNGKKYYQEFAKIKSKHVDFALCSPDNLYILLLIELDDNSHNSQSVSERDNFVETVYRTTGYKLYRAKGTANLEKDIQTLLNK